MNRGARAATLASMRSLVLLLLVACGTKQNATQVVLAEAPGDPSKIGGRAMWEPLTTPFAAAKIRVVQSTACAVSTTGKVACWGQVEHDDDAVLVERRAGLATPHVLVGVDNVIDVAHEWFYLCVAQREGSGDGGCFVTNEIGRKPPVFPKPPRALHATDAGICAVLRDGSAGCVDLDGKYTPARGVRDAAKLTCQQKTCCAITKAGAVQCWGDNKPAMPALANVAAIDWVWENGCAVTTSGGATCWGNAKALGTASGVRDVGIRNSTVCLVLVDGTLRCSAEDVPPATSVAELDYSCIRHTNGSVSCTGTNDHGELGDGSVMLSPVPVQVPGLDDVVDINIAHTNACALRRDKTLWCWAPNKPTAQGTITGAFIPGQYIAGCRTEGGAVRCGAAYPSGEWEEQTFRAPKVTNVKTAAIHRDFSTCLVDDAGAVQCRHGMSEGGVAGAWTPLGAPAPVEQLVPLSTGFCARHANGRVSCWVDHRTTTSSRLSRSSRS